MLTLVRIHKLVIACTLALTYSVTAQATVGQPGTLDPFWATGSPLGPGKVVTPVGNGSDTAAAVIVQPDGKVLLGGTCTGASNFDFCVVRYDALGVLDATFGSGGKVITAIGSQDDVATAMALQPDGKVLLVGHCKAATGTYHAFCAVRYNGNGTLDTANFGGGTGMVYTPVGPQPPAGNMTDIATAVVLQPDGKILVAGSCTNGATQFCVVRYNSNGTLDTAGFVGGTGKIFTTAGPGGLDTATAMTLQPDGKILVAGHCTAGSTEYFCVVRYNVDGTLDTATFNGTGKVITAVGNSAFANAIAVQPDSKILLAGYCRNATSIDDFCVVRYLSGGVPDNRFGSGGQAVTSVGPLHDHATAIVLQPDGKILLAGDCNPLSSDNINSVFCAARYHANGTLDTDFGNAGKVLTDFDGHDGATAMALQPDGRILVAGTCSSSTYDFCAVRYDGGPFGYQNCKLDIDGDGRVLATTDMLIGTRIALGMTGNAVINGINFPATATRNTWPLIRDYLVTQCGLSLVQ